MDGLESVADTDEPLDLFACDLTTDPELASLRGLKERVPWTVDSGASQSVANKEDFPGVTVRESEGSRRGQTYKGPGTDTIRNEGEFDASPPLKMARRRR